MRLIETSKATERETAESLKENENDEEKMKERF